VATWSITTDGNGFQVRKDRDRGAAECSEMDDALRHIKNRFKTGDKVVLVEADGYRTVITRQVARKSRRS
jgi:hypothetical protein